MTKTAALAPLRFVPDTNIAVSALLFPNGSLVWLRSAWQEKRFIPLVSQASATELMRVLEEFSWSKLVEEDGDDLEIQYRHTPESQDK